MVDDGSRSLQPALRYYPKSIIDFGATRTDLKLPTLNGGYALVTGTGFATPHVTGMVAILLEAFPGLVPAEAATILKSQCIDTAVTIRIDIRIHVGHNETT